MGILERISRRYPEDADARRLQEICRTMLGIQSACRPGGDKGSDLRTVLKVRFREFLRGSSGLIARGLSGLPEPWKERLGYGKWLQWQETF
ncbi:MAG: hypothetical protein J6A21_05915, partial [Lentisphaeria bacterium]|nr:hypothetical protein [Lentisphaeria bacterium]